MPTRLLMGEGHDITVFYANSNIAPREEYEKRLRELERYAESQGFAVIEGDFDPEAWEREVAPVAEAVERGEVVCEERCRACYRLRLEEAAAAAKAGGFDALASTLAVSPYQLSDVLREELDRACAQAGVTAHFEDYRPYYDEATRISRELGMYRQNYCGCRYSVKEAEETRERIKRERAVARAAREAERAGERAVEDEARRLRAAEKKAYADEKARRRAVLKKLRGK